MHVAEESVVHPDGSFGVFEMLTSCIARQSYAQELAVLQGKLAAENEQDLQELRSKLMVLLPADGQQNEALLLADGQQKEGSQRSTHQRLKPNRSKSSLGSDSTLGTPSKGGLSIGDFDVGKRGKGEDSDALGEDDACEGDVCMAFPEHDVVFEVSGLSKSPLARQRLSQSFQQRSEGIDQTCLQHFLRFMAKAMMLVESANEPERKGCVTRLVRSSFFNTVTMVVIILNAIFIALSTDHELRHPGEELTQTMSILEVSFSAFYVVELTLKLTVHRLYFFCNKDMRWNVFDFMLVLVSILENMLTFGADAGAINLTFLRLLRLCKMVKVLRIFRTLQFFTQLRLMAECVAGSCITGFWCVSLMFFILFTFALLICQGLVGYFEQIVSDGGELDLQEAHVRTLTVLFASVFRTMMTLFQTVSAGIDWHEVYDPLTFAGAMLPATYLFFILMFTVSVMNIVTSVFVENAMKLAKPDLESIVMEQSSHDQKERKHLTDLFAGREVSEGEPAGSMTLEEFRAVADDPKFRAYLKARGIDIKNVEVFFRMLASASGKEEVDVHVLANACVRMKGFATSIDLQSLSFQNQITSRKHAKCLKEVSRKFGRLERLLQPRPTATAVPPPPPRWSVRSRDSVESSKSSVSETAHKPSEPSRWPRLSVASCGEALELCSERQGGDPTLPTAQADAPGDEEKRGDSDMSCFSL